MNSKSRRISPYLPLYLMMIPGGLYFLINNYIPMAGVVIAFKNLRFKKAGIIRIILDSEWVGLNNFKYLFKTKDAFIITRNTILYNLAFIVLGTILAVMVAVFLNDLKNRKLTKFLQSSILLPYLMSMVIVSYLVYAFLGSETGFVNNTILPLFGREEISWYSETKYWPGLLTFIYLWKNVGYTCIVYLAAIVGIDPELYEAARLDGASKIHQIRHITLPLLYPVITLMVLLAVGRIFYSDFGLFFQVPLNSGQLYPVTNVIDTYVYRGLMQLGDISMSAATGLYQSAVGFALVMGSNLLVSRIDKDRALF